MKLKGAKRGRRGGEMRISLLPYTAPVMWRCDNL